MELAEILREFMSSCRGSMQMTGRIWPESLLLNASTLQHSMVISKPPTGNSPKLIEANSSNYIRQLPGIG